MKTIPFYELYETDYNISSLFAMRQKWKENSVFKMAKPRPTSCFLYFCGCSAEYTLPDGRILEVEKGSVVYIPEGAVYETRFFDRVADTCACILIEFSLSDSQGEHIAVADGITVLGQEHDPLRAELFSEAVAVFTAAVVSPSAMKAVVFRLITEYSRRERRRDLRQRRFGSIAKGIAYLETETGSDRPIAEIAEMCHVSESTFRRLFKEYAGVSPVEFRINAQMEYAKKLLRDGSMSVSEVAFAVGFQDPAYFCRVFKRKSGQTPKQFSESLLP